MKVTQDVVKAILEAGKVFLCYFPSNTTESLQPIDAGHGGLMRYKIGELLDTWLMQESNLA